MDLNAAFKNSKMPLFRRFIIKIGETNENSNRKTDAAEIGCAINYVNMSIQYDISWTSRLSLGIIENRKGWGEDLNLEPF